MYFLFVTTRWCRFENHTLNSTDGFSDTADNRINWTLRQSSNFGSELPQAQSQSSQNRTKHEKTKLPPLTNSCGFMHRQTQNMSEMFELQPRSNVKQRFLSHNSELKAERISWPEPELVLTARFTLQKHKISHFWSSFYTHKTLLENRFNLLKETVVGGKSCVKCYLLHILTLTSLCTAKTNFFFWSTL